MILATLSLALMLVESPYKPLPADGPSLVRAPSSKAGCKEMRVSGNGTHGGRAGLPFAMGRRFRSLDEYLVHLQCRARPIGLPWYKQISAGVYELQAGNVRKLDGNGTPQKRRFTRRELEQKFGFAK